MKFKLWPKTTVMRFSLVAFILIIILSVLSMGFLGIGLYFIASPALALLFPNIPNDMNTWHGDWVWPAMISMPIIWSSGFLIAGGVYQFLQKLDWTNLTLKTSYIVILLLWNLLIWFILLMNITPKLS